MSNHSDASERSQVRTMKAQNISTGKEEGKKKHGAETNDQMLVITKMRKKKIRWL